MAATVSLTDRGPTNNLAWRTVSVALDTSYPTGGYPITAAQLGFSKSRVTFVTSHSGGYVYEWAANGSNGGNLKAYRQTAATGSLVEVPNATSLSGVTVQLFVLGDVSA